MAVHTASSVLAIAWSAAIAVAYVFSTYLIGRQFVRRLRPGYEELQYLCRFSVGASLFGTLFSVLSIVGLAFGPLIVAAAFAPLGLEAPRLLRAARSTGLVHRERHPTVAHVVMLACVGLIVAYAVVLSLAPPRGGDMTIYHLVIPRTVSWNHGLVFNPFSHDAGLYYGWQLYALPAYLIGGDRGFQLCSLIAFGLLLFAVYRFISGRYSSLTGLAATFATAGVVGGMVRESIVNNDVPLVLLELGVLGLAFAVPATLSSALMIGLVGGFCVAVKLVAIATLALAYFILCWRARGLRYRTLAGLMLGTLLSLLPWAGFTFTASGSPLPHFLLIWPPTSGYLPEYREAISYLMEYFGIWYEQNVSRLFSQGLEFFPVLLLGFVAASLSKSARTDPVYLTLPSLALLRGLLLMLLNGFSATVLYHDRYHLTSCVLLAIGGLLGWRHALSPLRLKWPTVSATLLSVAVVIASIRLYRQAVEMVDVRGPNDAGGIAIAPSLQKVLYDSAHEVLKPPGGGRGGIGFDLAASILPPDAVVATTAIDPYLMQRRFMQMLPVSQNMIDLGAPPEQLLQEMKRHGATHLHLTEFSGLNAWMNPVVDRTLRSLRKVPELPNVHRLFYLNYSSAKGRQGIYALTDTQAPPLPKGELEDIRLVREPDGTWVVRWKAVPGAEVAVDWLQTPTKRMRMGYADTALGQFPMRLGMPAAFTLEVIVLVQDVAVQRRILHAGS